MVRGRQYDQWNHTAQLLALTYNAWRDRRSSSLSAADFHPLAKKQVPKVTLRQLADMGVIPKAQ